MNLVEAFSPVKLRQMNMCFGFNEWLWIIVGIDEVRDTERNAEIVNSI